MQPTIRQPENRILTRKHEKKAFLGGIGNLSIDFAN